MLDLSTGFTQEEIETLLATHKKNLLSLHASFADSGTAATKRSIKESERIIAACQRQLRAMDPETYGRRRSRISVSEAGHIRI